MPKRRLAGGLAATVAAVLVGTGTVAAVLVGILGWTLAHARADEAHGYSHERAAQRRAVAASRHVAAPAPAAPPPRSSKIACVTGVDTFAVAVERSLVPLPDAKARRVPALKAISDAAVRSERAAEQARPAPTLPRRMGLETGQPVAPTRRACDGAGFAELYGK